MTDLDYTLEGAGAILGSSDGKSTQLLAVYCHAIRCLTRICPQATANYSTQIQAMVKGLTTIRICHASMR